METLEYINFVVSLPSKKKKTDYYVKSSIVEDDTSIAKIEAIMDCELMYGDSTFY